MRKYVIEQKFKSAAAFLIILILLPYIVAVFVNGVDLENTKKENFYVRVKVPNEEEADEIAEVEWTEYLTGVLAKDVPADTEQEALKAQAVLVRTQVCRGLNGKTQKNGLNESDVVLDIDYLSRKEMQEQWPIEQYKKQYKKYREAVEETENEVLLYNGSYAWTPFHRSNGGMSRSAKEVMGSSDYPYLVEKECPADKEAKDEIGVFIFSYAEIQKKCRNFLAAETDGEKAAAGYTFEDFEILEYDSAGYVGKLRMGETICTGDQFRDAMSLPSSSFSLAKSGEKIKITTTGNGHGMGLSCWTANEMAREGKTYQEILKFFYEGTELAEDTHFVAKKK